MPIIRTNHDESKFPSIYYRQFAILSHVERLSHFRYHRHIAVGDLFYESHVWIVQHDMEMLDSVY